MAVTTKINADTDNKQVFQTTINSGTDTEMSLSRVGNIVMLFFCPSRTTTTTGSTPYTTLGTIPVGYRPIQRVVGASYFGENPPGNFSIYPDGTGQAFSATAGTAYMRFGATYITTDPFPTD